LKRYFINDGEIDVHITEWGRKDKPVIFCLHGLGSTGLSFIEMADQLKEEFRIISIDAPGHGKTGEFTQPERYEMPALANWLDKIIGILHIDQFYFLSHSWGSFVALFYLQNHAEKVLGSLLIDGGYQTKRLIDKTIDEEVAYYEEDFEMYTETWEEFLEEAVYNGPRQFPFLDIAAKDLVLEKEGRFYWHARGRTAGYIIRGMHKHETEDIYDQLPPNIVLLRATLPKNQDSYREMTSRLFEQKTRGIVKLIPNTSHMLHWDNPESVLKEIKNNWSRL
jgi:pimeloyl-ACP methyl ester carboxylesterase